MGGWSGDRQADRPHAAPRTRRSARPATRSGRAGNCGRRLHVLYRVIGNGTNGGRTGRDRTSGARVIRTAVPAEAEAIAALHARARATYYPDGVPDDGTDWVAAWRAAVERPDGQVLCAVEGGCLVAVASFRTPPGAAADTVRLFQFHVDPGHWRSRVGTALHAACVDKWRAQAARTAVLDVHVGNRRAQAFYARMGWTADPTHPPAPDDHHLCLRYAVSGALAAPGAPTAE